MGSDVPVSFSVPDIYTYCGNTVNTLIGGLANTPIRQHVEFKEKTNLLRAGGREGTGLLAAQFVLRGREKWTRVPRWGVVSILSSAPISSARALMLPVP